MTAARHLRRWLLQDPCANLRVGFVAAHPSLAAELRDIKALTGLSSSEIGERVVARIIIEHQYERMLRPAHQAR
jgi:DNA-binding transcriptional MocR family regulator